MPNVITPPAAAAPTLTCAICSKDYRETYGPCRELDRMKRDGLCFNCAFWELQAERPAKTVIDHCIYSPGRRTTGEFRGCAGRRFDIEYFADGHRITTFDLWVGGDIPERWRDRIPNTARFLNGAGEVQVSEMTCWNPSRSRDAPYPLPNETRK